ncbi:MULTISPECIES: hypothetical protein [unclassified Rathayibacter]|uniref:hypothetical protein n=1 Tax=unclassified Rathayibacter TaxID=2609250 RepID=UPI00104E184C|nr:MULTISPECIES: hypothetical protein [unclassified Rathayibacter]MCJ1704003.1 hypothetical protein [Rathayibacter sp. VKM Ac-2926]TCL82465.1 hypothetical protein EDF49_10517 [Rathayibacter sp. PhB192]TCM27804.1 hypothetical protein EDF43_10517 [Rathayibacter sp. PhB179]
MTVQHEGAPLTRREIRERERAAAGAAPAAAPTTSRRAATASVTAAGEMPVLTATQALRVPVVAPTPAAEPELSTSAIEVVLPEGVDRSTLTRRELRALLAQQQAEQVAATPEAAPVDAAQESAKAEPDAVAEATAAEASAPEASDVEQPADESEQSNDEPEQPKLNTALFATVGTLDIADEKATEITGSFHPPIEHLAITDELDSKSKEEVDASFDSLIASGVAATGAVTTTNALILPTAGDASPVRTDTGEVLVTGSFDLPRSLGSTGQHPNLYDSPDVDRYVDRIDREQPASDSEPVRASSAVSTHAAGTAMIAPQKRRAVSVPVVLAITAAVLLVASIALFIGGFVLNIF